MGGGGGVRLRGEVERGGNFFKEIERGGEGLGFMMQFGGWDRLVDGVTLVRRYIGQDVRQTV